MAAPQPQQMTTRHRDLVMGIKQINEIDDENDDENDDGFDWFEKRMVQMCRAPLLLALGNVVILVARRTIMT